VLDGPVSLRHFLAGMILRLIINFRNVVLLGVAATVGLLTACPGETPPEPSDGFDRKAMFRNLGENVVLPAYRTFAERAAALEEATAALEAAVGTPDETSAREAAQRAWRDAFSAWQVAEPMRVGPAGTMGSYTGGATLRDEIYSWPVVNPCRIDQELVAGRYANADFFSTSLVNVYGLDALEYLLFHVGAQNSCAAQAEINTSGSWNALGSGEVTRRRAAYAHAATTYLKTVADDLVERWEPSGGNFVGQLAQAGMSGSLFETERMAADEIFTGMFYLDLVTKDDKLAVPAGIDVTCASDTCPEALESRYANASKEAVRANLEGFRQLFTGGDGLGFDDWLVAVGAGELAAQMKKEIDEAIEHGDAIPGNLRDTLATDPETVRTLHAEVKHLTDLMKSQFVSVLNLSVPDEGAADND